VSALVIRKLGAQEYTTVWEAMQSFTHQRNTNTIDEAWLVQHPPVFTLGLAGKIEHVLDARQIPVVKTDRGGQVTYHGPGQLIVYLLLDLRRHSKGVRQLVNATETAIINMLAELNIQAHSRPEAPGVYVGDKKIAALGFRVRRGCCYHGLSLNIDMDLMPFTQINPCGYAGLEVTQIKNLGKTTNCELISKKLIKQLAQSLHYDEIDFIKTNHLPV